MPLKYVIFGFFFCRFYLSIPSLRLFFCPLFFHFFTKHFCLISLHFLLVYVAFFWSGWWGYRGGPRRNSFRSWFDFDDVDDADKARHILHSEQQSQSPPSSPLHLVLWGKGSAIRWIAVCGRTTSHPPSGAPAADPKDFSLRGTKCPTDTPASRCGRLHSLKCRRCHRCHINVRVAFDWDRGHRCVSGAGAAFNQVISKLHNILHRRCLLFL